ncbi:MAG: FimV/HubP family polar landmark protein [Rhodanobacter sp.]
MNRTLKLSMLVALALGSSQLLALDLGQVQVKSALGQPLLAEIPLHPANPAELKGLTVKLASNEQFARAGIVGGRTSIPLQLSVANTAGAHPVIRITSSVPVDNPYLDLLIEVDGHAGKSVREYAILLDPPGAAAPVAMAAPRPSEPMQAKPAKVAAAPVSRPAAAAPAAAPTGVSNGRYGPVQSGQTLSGIARNVAPAGVDVQQMLLALKQANPDAFYKDNINALKSGAVLRVPTSAEAQAMTLAAAAAEVRRQNSDWRGGTPSKPSIVADAGTRASSSSSPSATAAGNEDRLALVPPKVGGDTGNQGSGKGDKASAALRDDLLRAKENVASLQQQSGDLKTRLKDLTDINSKNEHLLSLKDSEIAELQAKLAAARKTANTTEKAPAMAASVAAAPQTEPKPAATVALEPAVATAGTSASENASPVVAASSASVVASPASVGATDSTAMATTSSTSTVAVSASTALQTAVATPAASVAKPAASTQAAATTPAPVATQVVKAPWYMQTWAWAAGAAVVVLLIVLAMLGRRRKPAAAGSRSASSLADRFGAPSSAADEHLLDDDDTDQEQLLDQLAEHPDDIYLHLELVTLYYSRRDVERFEAAAEAMHVHVTDPQQDEWQDVLHMGEDLAPEHPLFDHHESAAPDHAALADAFDIDDYHDKDDAPTVVSQLPPSLPAGPKKVSEYNFNFDLTHPAGSETAPPAATPDEDVTVIKPHAQADTWALPEVEPLPGAGQEHEATEFSDDPVDTKLDLARAYLDMGDADGARAMLGEVLKEGSQMQRDTARRLLDGIS